MAWLRTAAAICWFYRVSRAAQQLLRARSCGAVVTLMAALFLAGATAAAQNSGDQGVPQTREALQTEYDALFERMLKDPGDLDVTFRFAEVATELGNYEAAVSAYERMLLFNPDLPRVKFELGVLYFRLGSFDIARSYFTAAQESPDVPPAVQEHIKSFLAEIDERSSAHKLHGSVLAGMRYQSDASVGPSAGLVSLGNGPGQPGQNIANTPTPKRGDWNAFTTGNVQHSYDLGLQNNALIETNGLYYYSKQIDQNSVDLALVEFNTGPRFDLTYGDAVLVNVRPYGIVNNVFLDHEQYFFTLGTGLELSRTITEKLAVGSSYEFRFKRFANSKTQPLAVQFDSVVHSFATDLRYALLDNGTLGVGSSYAKEDARVISNSNRAIEFRGSYTHSFDSPLEFLDGPLVVTPAIYRVYTDYDARDETIVGSDGATRKDNEWRYVLTAQLGLYKGLTGHLQLQRQVVDSTVINFKYNNTSVTLGLLWNF